MIDAREVTGTISVKADNVTIRRTRILNTGYYPIRVFSGFKNLLVEDVEINGRGKASAAVAFSNYTLRRVNIHNVNEGPRLGACP